MATTPMPPADGRPGVLTGSAEAGADGSRPARAIPGTGILWAVAAMLVVLGWAGRDAGGDDGALAPLVSGSSVGLALALVLVGHGALRPYLLARQDGAAVVGWWPAARPWLLRLVPAAWLVAVVARLLVLDRSGELPTVAFSPEPLGETAVPLLDLVRDVTFSASYGGSPLSGPTAHLWPISVALLGALVVAPLVARAGRLLPSAVAALGAVGLAFRLGVVAVGPDTSAALTTLPAQLDLLALGMGLALLGDRSGRSDRSAGSRIDRAGGPIEVVTRWATAPAAPLVGAGAALVLVVAASLVLDLPATVVEPLGVRGLVAHLVALVAVALVAAPVLLRPASAVAGSALVAVADRWGRRLAYPAYLWAPLVLGRWVSAPGLDGAAAAPARHPGELHHVALLPTLAWTLVVTGLLALATWWLVCRPWERYLHRSLSWFAGGLWAISLSSFAMRIWTFDTIMAKNPGNGDQFYYHAQANMLADGQGFGDPFLWLTEGRFLATAIHPPLFTLWLTPASLVGARGFLAHKALAAVAGVAVVVVAALLARRLAGPRAGLLAAVLVALAPNFWIIDGTLWSEGLYTATVGLALLAAYHWKDGPSLGRAALVGAAVGASVLSRGEAIFLLPFLCLPMAWTARRSLPRWTVHAGVMGLAAVAVVAPWTVRNLLTFDRPVPVSTNSEEVLFYANCSDTYEGRLIGYWSFACQDRVRAERTAQGLPADPPGDEAERAAGWGELGRDYALDNKRRWPSVVVARVTRGWDLQYSSSNLDALVFEGRPRPWSERGLVVFRLSLVAGLVGFGVLRNRRVTWWPLAAMLVMTTFTMASVYGHVRFRTASDLVLLVLSAVALDNLLPGRRRTPEEVALAGTGGAAPKAVGAAVGGARGGAEDDGDDSAYGDDDVEVADDADAAVLDEGGGGDADGPGAADGRPGWSRWRPDRLSVLAVALVAVVLALPLHTLFRYQGPPMEEGFMLVFPERVLAGDVPNKDFLHLYGPGSLWALAGWYKVAGVSIFAERLFGLAQLAGIIFGVMALARPWGRKVAVAAGVVGVLITTTAIGLAALAWNGAVALCVASLWVGLRARRWLTDAPDVARSVADRRADRLLVASGVLAGLALLFRPDVVIAVTLATLALLSGLGWARWRRWLLGVVPTGALIFVHLAMAGPGNAIDGMFLEPVFDLRAGRSLPRPPSPYEFEGALQKVAQLRPPEWALPAATSPRQAWLWFFLLPVASLFVVAVGAWRVRAEPSAWKPRVLLATGLLGLGLLPQAFQRPDTTHLAWVSCVTLAFLPAAIAELLRHAPLPSLRRGSTAIATAVVVAIPVLVVPHFTARNYADLVQQTGVPDVFGFPVHHEGRTFYLGAPDIAPAAQGVVDDLGREAEPGQRLFVGTADLRKTPYSDAYLYYLLPELVPATRYIEMDPGMANAEDSGLAEEVAGSDWLILSHVWDAWAEPNTSLDFGSDEPNQVVDRDFCLFKTYGTAPTPENSGPVPFFEVYRRCR